MSSDALARQIAAQAMVLSKELYAMLDGSSLATFDDRLRDLGIRGEAGAVSAYQVRLALADQGKLQAIIDALPADPTNPAAIRWHANAPVKQGDQLANWIASTLSYNSAAMATLLTSAALF